MLPIFFWSQSHHSHGDLATIIIKPMRLVTDKKTIFLNNSFLPTSNEIHSFYDNVFNIPIKFSHFLFEKNYNYHKLVFISCSFFTKYDNFQLKIKLSLMNKWEESGRKFGMNNFGLVLFNFRAH